MSYRIIEDKELKQALAIQLRSEGIPDSQITKRIGVGVATIRDWLGPSGRSSGRPIEHREERLALALQLKAEGLSNAEISRRVGVSQPTVGRWVNPAMAQKHQDSDRLHKGRQRQCKREEIMSDPMQTLPMVRPVRPEVRRWCIARAVELGVKNWNSAEAYVLLRQAVFEYIDANPIYMGFYGRQRETVRRWIRQEKAKARLF